MTAQHVGDTHDQPAEMTDDLNTTDDTAIARLPIDPTKPKASWLSII
ncbi:hypothetical protein ACFQU9_13595 [Actinomadura namibiensis]|uniref:Uncharacterized protein n=1 Tax=Actinomadura namibiensis TaxID=182080 RepID=A0A7W3LYX3_ACTNM|nr:hypothetical protein [Actinomadura namibiensis]MBA8956792.1 hypothetical protein [Actinomadura namibiensis]